MRDDELLRKTYNLVAENNRLIRSIRRRAFLLFVFKLIIWAVLLGVPVYLYFTVFQPFVGDVAQVFQQSSASESGSGIPFFDIALIEQLAGLLENMSGVDFSNTEP